MSLVLIFLRFLISLRLELDIDEIVPPADLMEKALEKAEDLATLGHPYYMNTKNVYQADVVAKIKEGIEGARPPGQTA